MGKIDVGMKRFLSDKRRFADLFNGVCFQGETIIKAEELHEKAEGYPEAAEGHLGPKAGERSRDVKMLLESGAALRVLAIENQNHVDYTMPVRCMQYDCLEYEKQIRKIKGRNKEKKKLKSSAEWLSGLVKEDRLAPVYTLCLYHGEEKWDGPRNLQDMMNFGEDKDKMSALFADYPMRIFCVNEHCDFGMFHSELKEVFMALNYRRDRVKLRTLMQENEAYRHMSEDALEILVTLLNIPQIWREKERFMSKNGEEEEYDMCLALQEWSAEERSAGRAEGKEEGRAEGKAEGKAEGRAEGVLLASRIFKLLNENSSLKNEVIAKECGCSVDEVKDVRLAFGI